LAYSPAKKTVYIGTQGRPAAATLVAALAGLAALTAWAYWPTFTQLVHLWNTDDGYSHGYLVPAFAVWLLWLRRDRAPMTWQPRPVLGLTLIALALTLRTVAALRFNLWPEHISLIPYLLGIAMAFGGWPLVRYTAAAIAFLAFMVRLPYRVEVSLGAPLQQLATIVSTFILQTIGLPAIAEGNTIHIREAQLEVVQACSGLKMLMTFLAFSTAACLVVRKPLGDKLVILASAAPIAIAVNVIRIVTTGILHLNISSEAAFRFLHDMAGWFMMPLALAFLGAELWILKHLIVELPARAPVRRKWN
jgi:exosortase